jgi:hypothetical protein
MVIRLPQKEIDEFLESLKKVVHSLPYEPKKKLFDLGLIILEKEHQLTAKDIFNLLPENKKIFFELINPYYYDDFVEKLITANREGQLLFVNCKADPAPTIIKLLKQLSETNEFSTTDVEDKELFSMKLNPKTRVIFCIDNDFLETKITYPYFISLFGPILRL